MKTINIEDVTTKAVHAALDIIDEAVDKTSRRSPGPCGDELAYVLHETIKTALIKHMAHPDLAPAFVKAEDCEEELEAIAREKFNAQ